MKKPFTKIICATLASVVAVGISAAAGCSPYNEGIQLYGDDIFTADKAVSNGGFAVEKGGYVYFINGVTDNTVDNTFGTPDKGAVKRIAKKDLDSRNYSSAETVVPQIYYSDNYNAGLFIYGDYIYYSTPCSSRDSDGNVRNGELELKRTKLDGTESIKDPYITFPNASYDFRFVEDGGEVYILYVASGETLYGEQTGVTNLHSLKISTGENSLLAYNLSSYKFDEEDKTNPVVYYTMGVMSYETGETESYNQIYKVTASDNRANEYDTSKLVWWNGDEDRYVNCGELVFDGVGGKTTTKTPFNYMPQDETVINDYLYSYTLKSYVNGNLFYTRHTPHDSSEYLYSIKTADIGEDHNPVAANPAQREDYILKDGSSASSLKYIFDDDGELQAVLYAGSGSGGILINYVTGGAGGGEEKGKIAELAEENIDNDKYFRIVRTGTATILNVDTENKYVYYSITGGNGYTFNRVKYDGKWSDYDGMAADDAVSDYTPVRILDLDASSDWYSPEFLNGNILFSSETDNMTAFNYIMAFDLRGEDGNIMTNSQIDALNDLYDGVIGNEGLIADYSDSEKYDQTIYANLSNAARYLFYNNDKDYIDGLAVACNANVEEGADPVYSESTLAKLAEFLAPAEDNDWAGYTATRKVNGADVYANRRDYYYSTLGVMTEADASALRDSFRTEYLQAWPEQPPVPTWWDGLNKPARVFFVMGMCVLGLMAIAFVMAGILALVGKKRGGAGAGVAKRRRIKVDTTDDKNVDVYGDGDGGENESE